MGRKFADRQKLSDIPKAAVITEGFTLGEIRDMNPRALKDHPENHVFDSQKTAEYWARLKRDISETGKILEPIIINSDDVIISGHSRRRVAVELLDEGRTEFTNVPVRTVISPLTPEDECTRAYLANLSRFEMDIDTRTALYARIYPEYFNDVKRGETVSPPPATRKEVAAEMGVSERQVKNEKGIYQAAKAKAKTHGRLEPTPDDMKGARKDANAKRRKERAAKPVAKSVWEDSTPLKPPPRPDTTETQKADDDTFDVYAPDKDEREGIVKYVMGAFMVGEDIVLSENDVTSIQDTAQFRAAVIQLLIEHTGGQE